MCIDLWFTSIVFLVRLNLEPMCGIFCLLEFDDLLHYDVSWFLYPLWEDYTTCFSQQNMFWERYLFQKLVLG